ncbi:MAG: NAD-dependent epimerase/dehydratase family protein [Alphaproteobacteria bacterium]
MTVQTLLVTGGGGFVLSHLVRQWLDADKNNRAIILDAAPLDDAAVAWFAGVKERLHFVQGSVVDPSAWAAISENDITHIVHGAAVTSISRLFENSFSDGAAALEVNMTGAVRALDFASRCPNLHRMVHVSTGSVYGTHGPEKESDPLPEDGYIDPDGFYGITKYAGEQLAVQAASQLGLPVVAIRLSSIYGPMDRETPARAVDLDPGVLMRRALAGEAAKVTGLGGAGDYLIASDVGRAIRALFDAPTLNHRVYNVANGVRVSMGELVDMVAHLVPGFSAKIVGPEEADIVVDPAKTGGRWNAYDISRITGDTGWRPLPLSDALELYRDWLMANR